MGANQYEFGWTDPLSDFIYKIFLGVESGTLARFQSTVGCDGAETEVAGSGNFSDASGTYAAASGDFRGYIRRKQ